MPTLNQLLKKVRIKRFRKPKLIAFEGALFVGE